MKIILTGSLGYIGTPLTKKLVEKGHSVTLISRNPERQQAIEALGAKPAIGTMENVDFLTHTFSGADAVYCMVAPYGDFTDPTNTAEAVIARANAVAHNYVQAIEQSGVKRVVYLSSIGAHMPTGAGLIIVHHNAENTLNELSSDVNISFMRPAGFYKNLFAFTQSIKQQGMIKARYGEDDRNVFASNLDIAEAIVDELGSTLPGRQVRYVVSDEMNCNQAAHVLGRAIGKPDLKWISISDQQQLQAYMDHGMNESLAHMFTQMNASIHSGQFYNDYDRHKPLFGRIKMNDFAESFAQAYANN